MKVSTFESGAGDDVVVIHGWSHDHGSMRPIIDLLKPHYKVTAVDLPGASDSEWDESFSTINEVVDSMLDALPDNAIYVCWSWGGAVAQSIAGRYPERVKQLVLISSVPKFIEDDDWPGVPKPGFKDAFDFDNDKTYREFLIAYYGYEFADNKDTSTAYAELVGNVEKYGPAIPIDIEFQGLGIIDNTDLREEFSQIQCRIDMIHGTKDESVPLDWGKVKALNSRLNLHFIEDAMHMAFWTHPDEFNAILCDVLNVKKQGQK